MCVLQGTLISPNKIRQATETALPRRYSICGKQSAAESSLSLLPYDIRFPPQQEPALYGRMALRLKRHLHRLPESHYRAAGRYRRDSLPDVDGRHVRRCIPEAAEDSARVPDGPAQAAAGTLS